MLGLHFKMLSSLILLLYKVLELNQGQMRLGNVSFQWSGCAFIAGLQILVSPLLF